jgi:dihydrofolate reductase
MKLGLVDVYELVVNPIMLGSGTALFKPGLPSVSLQLDGVRTFRSGALVLAYHPTGAQARDEA